MTGDTETIREARELAGTVLEVMSEDSGPAECEPFTGWCVDLARALLAALAALGRVEEREAEAAKMLQDAQEMLEEQSWTASSVHRAASILTVVRRARAALADSVAGEEQGQTYGSDPGRASAASTSRETAGDIVLGRCAHGVDLDREFCPEGCRV